MNQLGPVILVNTYVALGQNEPIRASDFSQHICCTFERTFQILSLIAHMGGLTNDKGALVQIPVRLSYLYVGRLWPINLNRFD